MNFIQRVILVIGLAAITRLILYPPYTAKVYLEDGVELERYVGHHHFKETPKPEAVLKFFPPLPKSYRDGYLYNSIISQTRLWTGMALILTFMVALVFIFGSVPKP